MAFSPCFTEERLKTKCWTPPIYPPILDPLSEEEHEGEDEVAEATPFFPREEMIPYLWPLESHLARFQMEIK